MISTVWTFEAILDTHSVNLDQDLTKTAVLIDDKKNEYKSISWEGDPAGGHHRKGILKFKPVLPFPSKIELKLKDIACVDKSFRCNL